MIVILDTVIVLVLLCVGVYFIWSTIVDLIEIHNRELNRKDFLFEAIAILILGVILIIAAIRLVYLAAQYYN